MSVEYLLFNLLVLVPVIVVSRLPQAGMAGRWRSVGVSILAMAVPFLVWDAWVTGRHWHFNEAYVLPLRIARLPLGEILFFASVPFACLFTWLAVFRRWPERTSASLAWLRNGLMLLAPVGIALFAAGREYTGLTLVALSIVAALDRMRGTDLLLQPRFLAFLGAVVGFTFVFNGYLTARPVVLYGESYQLGFRVFTIPIEDFGYGIALVCGVAVGFEAAEARRLGRRRDWIGRLIERRFGGYRHRIDAADPARPRRLESPRSAAVVGGGLAGLSAAATLAERGFAVTLLEKNDYLGGKVGAWRTTLPTGESVGVEHGFHAFFRHYYNLWTFLGRVGATAHMVPIDDYRILSLDGARYSFRDVDPTPLRNLLSLARHGIYRIRDVALGPAGREMEAFFHYDSERTFAEFDGMSFAEFADRAQLPPGLRLVFHTFARAFFADAEKLSMAELIKSFHSYYLCHDHGLLYDYPNDDYGKTLLAPIRRHLEAHGARIETGRSIERIERAGEGFAIDGVRFDDVVLAADARSARRILECSEFVAREAKALHADLPHLRTGQRYAMLRLWLDRDARTDLPVFTITEKRCVLDSISCYHRIERESAEWVERHGGGIFELHCYAVPDDVGSDEEVRKHFLEELEQWLPELAGAEIRHEVLQVRDDFAAYHVGMAAHRPGVDTGIPGLYLAGDWVRLPCPAMLMEAACTAGLLAANAILARRGLREEPVHTVPLRGLLAR